MDVKTIIWQTNYAGKMGYIHILHVGILPPQGLKNFNWSSQSVIIKTKDDSHEPIEATLKDVCVYRFDELPEYDLERSHKMTKQQFVDFMRTQQKTIVNYNTLVGVYVYQKKYN